MTVLIKSQVEITPGSIAIGSSGKGKKIDRIDGDILHCGSLKIRSSAVVNVIPVLKVGSRYLLNGDRSITLESISEDGIGYTQLSIYGFMLFGAIESIAPISEPPIDPRLALAHVNGRIEVNLDKLDLNYRPSVQTPSWSPTISVKPYEQLAKLYLDIETTGLHPEVDRVLMVGMMSESGVKTIITDPDEKVLLSQTMEFLRVNKPELLIGHNLFNFDLPFLAARCRINGVPNPFTKAYKTSRITSASVNGQLIEFTPIYWKGTQILDTFQQVAIWDNYQMNYVPNLPFQTLAIASPALKAQKIHERLLPNLEHEADGKSGFDGGTVELVRPGLHSNVAKIDVSSLYPSIVLRYGICSRKDTGNRFLGVLLYAVGAAEIEGFGQTGGQVSFIPRKSPQSIN